MAEVLSMKRKHVNSTIGSNSESTKRLLSTSNSCPACSISLAAAGHLPDPEVMRLIAHSEFLGYQELGRYLLFTSKALTKSIFSAEEVWKLLLQIRFNFPTNLPLPIPSVASFREMQIKRLFLSLVTKESRRPAPEIRTLGFRAEDYSFIFNIHSPRDLQGQRTTMVTKIIEGESISSFFINGCFEVPLTSRDTPKFDINLGYGVSITLHVMRSDGKSMCLFDSYDSSGPDGDMDNMYFFVGSESLIMSDLIYQRHLYEIISSKYPGDGPINTGLIFDVDLFFSVVRNETCVIDDSRIECGCCYCCPIMHSFDSVRVGAKLDFFDDYLEFPSEVKSIEGKQITFAHILEGLRGWEE